MILPAITFIIIQLWLSIPETNYICWDIAWVYSIATKNIYLCEWVIGDKEFYRQHEIGHYVWFNILTQLQKDRYEVEYKKATSFYREYSKVLIEDFADNYALIAINHPYIKNNNRRLSLIRLFTKTKI
jgi:hypothetical protein